MSYKQKNADEIITTLRFIFFFVLSFYKHPSIKDNTKTEIINIKIILVIVLSKPTSFFVSNNSELEFVRPSNTLLPLLDCMIHNIIRITAATKIAICKIVRVILKEFLSPNQQFLQMHSLSCIKQVP